MIGWGLAGVFGLISFLLWMVRTIASTNRSDYLFVQHPCHVLFFLSVYYLSYFLSVFSTFVFHSMPNPIFLTYVGKDNTVQQSK